MNRGNGDGQMTGIIKCFNRDCLYHDISNLDHCSKPLTQIRECPHAKVRKDRAWVKCGNHYLDELMSNECVCGNDKNPKKSFCYPCFASLPQELKNDLYSRMGDGYEQAYDAANKYLEVLR